MKKCPPGVICIENVTMFIIIIVFAIIIYIFHLQFFKSFKSLLGTNKDYINEKESDIVINNNTNYPYLYRDNNYREPSYPYNNLPLNVLQNPYVPPLSDNRYFVNRPIIPINVSTNVGAVDTEYRQLGILTPLNGVNKDNILPLMGRPLFVNRQKYQYYTISNQHNNVKLPVSVKGKSGTNEYGVDQIFNGDSVYIEGYNTPFRVTIYDNDTIKYLPFL
jgi:hypothetical protein